MKIDCQLLPGPRSGESEDRLFVVIDVLRATSTIVTGFMNGCQSIVPVVEVEEAFRLADGPLRGALIGGERGGFAVEGFDLGNSPQEYTKQRVEGRTIIITTTNGSRAFRSLPHEAVGAVASFLNLDAVVRHCLTYRKDVSIMSSGREGGFSLEDAVCAGEIVESIWRRCQDRPDVTDAALASMILYNRFQGDLVEMLRSSVHGRYLEEIGLGEDLQYCAQVDLTDIVPIYREGKIEL